MGFLIAVRAAAALQLLTAASPSTLPLPLLRQSMPFSSMPQLVSNSVLFYSSFCFLIFSLPLLRHFRDLVIKWRADKRVPENLRFTVVDGSKEYEDAAPKPENHIKDTGHVPPGHTRRLVTRFRPRPESTL